MTEAATETAPRKGKEKQRIYLYLNEGPEEARRALEYLDAKYPDDPNHDEDEDGPRMVRKVNEIRLDRLGPEHVVIPVVRDINKDRTIRALLPTAREDQVPTRVKHEKLGEVRECKPVYVADFYKRGRGRDSEDAFNEDRFLQAIGQVCLPAGPRVQNRGGGKHHRFKVTRYLVLKWA